MGDDKRVTLHPPPTPPVHASKKCKNISIQTMYAYFCRF